MKFSVSLYSFFSALRAGEITLLECVDKAKEMGFDAIEAVDFVMGCPPEEMPEMAKKIKERADQNGLEISSFAVGADLLNGQDGSGDSQKEIARVKSMVDIAAILGAPRMRHDIKSDGPKGQPQKLRGPGPPAGGAGAGDCGLCPEQGHFDHDREPWVLLPGL